MLSGFTKNGWSTRARKTVYIQESKRKPCMKCFMLMLGSYCMLLVTIFEQGHRLKVKGDTEVLNCIYNPK